MKVINLIGNTPLVQLENIGGGRIYAKLERNNPAGSIKDRPAYFMINEAIKSGQLKEGMKIVEPTSGNTGIALAMIGKMLGFHVVLVMPETMSLERRKLIQSYGAEIILTGQGGMAASVEKARELVETGEYFMPDQFSNPANPLAHEKTTGPEIIHSLDSIAGFIAGIGTGGTVTGMARAFRNAMRDTEVWGIEPEESPLISMGQAGSHKIQGIGANFIPKNLDQGLVKKIIRVKGDDAIKMAKILSREEGLSVGISSGANIFGALRMAEEIDGNIVTVLPDGSDRYMSTELFED